MGTWNGGEHSDTRSYGKRGCGGKFSGAGGKTACDSCIVWVVQRGGDLSWKDDRREKDEYAKAYAKRFLILSIIMGILGGTVILAVSPLASAALTLSGTAKEYLRIMFFVMSYFVVGQAINTTLVVGCSVRAAIRDSD